MGYELRDKIHIRDLRARCIVGIYPDEREKPQEILINLTLYVDLQRAGVTDAIEDTVDYKEIKKQVLSLVEASSCYLVERLAEQIAQCCLETTGVIGVKVCVDKPGALRFARSVAVEITRTREHG